MSTKKLITIRVREDDLRAVLHGSEGWWDSLRDAAYGERQGPPDAQTLSMAKLGLLATARLRVAASKPIRPRGDAS